MFSRVVRIALPLLIVSASIGGMTALVKSKPEREPLGAEELSWPVAVAPIEVGTVTPQLVLFALVDSPRVTHLSSAVTADVMAVDVLEGQEVLLDDRLVALDDREIRLVLAQRDAEMAGFQADLEHEMLRHRNNLDALNHEEALLEITRREVARARDLAERKVGSQASLDKVHRDEKRQMLAVEQRRLAIREHESRRKQIEAKLAKATAQQSQAMLDLERTRVYPPFAGRITEVFVSPGNRVRPGDRLITLFDSDVLELRAQIPLRFLPVVRTALNRGERLAARARVDGQEMHAVLHRLTAQVGRGSGGADGLFRVTQGSAWLQLGRTVEIVLDLPAVEEAVAVPREALYGTDRVFVLDGERMRSVAVERFGETHPNDGDSRVILRSPGLKFSDWLIVTHLPNAIDGLKVTVAVAPPG